MLSAEDLEYFIQPTAPKAPTRFEQLRKLMALLRSPDGCPWDNEQTLLTLRKYVLEEAQEVADAMTAVAANPTPTNWHELCDEVGDLLLECFFVARFGEELDAFDIYDALELLRQKLVRRHPHVFGSVTVNGSDEVLHNWNVIKAAEKQVSPHPLNIEDEI